MNLNLFRQCRPCCLAKQLPHPPKMCLLVFHTLLTLSLPKINKSIVCVVCIQLFETVKQVLHYMQIVHVTWWCVTLFTWVLDDFFYFYYSALICSLDAAESTLNVTRLLLSITDFVMEFSPDDASLISTFWASFKIKSLPIHTHHRDDSCVKNETLSRSDFFEF